MSSPLSGRRATIYYGGFLRTAGGAFSHVRDLREGLVARGWEVRVVTLDDLPLRWRYVPHLVERAVNLVRAPLGFWWKGRITRRLYRRHLSDDATFLVFEDIYLGWDSRTPSVTILHAVWSDNLQGIRCRPAAKAALMRKEVALIEGSQIPIATVSAPYAAFLQDEHFSARLARALPVIELGIRQERSAARPKLGRKSLVYAGALEPRKNIRFLLEVYRAVHKVDPTYGLTIIGDGPEFSQTKALAAEWGLPVRFLGKLPRDDVRVELLRHDIYIHTSTKESFSFSLLEAKLAGLTTCASATLQVPPEFIDCGMRAFEVDEWCRVILAIKPEAKAFNAAKFTLERMTCETLRLAGLEG